MTVWGDGDDDWRDWLEDGTCDDCECDPCQCDDDDDDGFYGETLAERNPSLK